MKSQRVIIVTGMHRSGTSCVAGLVEAIGVNLGEDIGSSKDNKWGFKEDVTFVELHNIILRRSGQSILVQNVGDLKIPEESDSRRAKSLIEDRESLSCWGWKNPRTALYLDFWHALIPDARYLFVYRHPIDVTLSLLRRGADVEALVDPLMAFQSWLVYNKAILDFYHANTSRCCLCNISEVAEDVDTALALFSDRLWLPEPPAGAGDVMHRSGLHQYQLTSEDERQFEEIAPQAAALYRELEAAADLPSRATERPDRRAEALVDPPETTGRKAFQLLERIDPELVAKNSGNLLERVQDLREAKVWWEEYCASVTAQQASQILALKEDNAWLREQVKNWRREVEARGSVIEERVSQILALLEGKAWLAGHVESWQDVVVDRDSVVMELRSHIEALEAGKAWLAGQIESWQGVAADRERVILELKAYVTELDAGRQWLEGQVVNRRGVAEARERVIEELRSSLAEMEEGRLRLEGQIENWRAEVKGREAQLQELRTRIEN